jgi:GPH family glycoside/pentoside/hexuronide:cation symporter
MIAFFTLKLVALLGGDDPMRGFLLVALLFGTLATLILWFAFANTIEAAPVANAPQPSAGDMVRMLRSNRAFWLVAGTMLMGAMASTFFGKTIPYFFKYGVGREDLIGPALATITGCAMISIPFWTGSCGTVPSARCRSAAWRWDPWPTYCSGRSRWTGRTC